MSSLMEVRNLTAGFGESVIVKGINMQVAPKEIMALIGPSGCGKSTFLRCLNRMHEEALDAWVQGQVLIEGQDVFASATDPVEVRRQIGMVFQKPNPFPSMSIFDNVVSGLLLRGSFRRSQLNEIAEKSLRGAALWEEVKDRLHKDASGLSGGQQQRLCIARALTVEPKLLLMDEPTSALDPLSTAKIEELALQLRETVTVVIVTHNMQQARRISDRTGFFLTGELVELQRTSELFTNPKDTRTESYITGRFG